MPFTGFAELQTPIDLFKKLKHDLKNVLAAPGDQYAAFNFFVTAEHLVDWLHPNDKQRRTALRGSTPELRITSHIANGLKHFSATAKHHNSVNDVEKVRYVEEGYVEEGYFEDPLIVNLSQKEAPQPNNTTIRVDDLAQKVYDYWKAQFHLKNI